MMCFGFDWLTLVFIIGMLLGVLVGMLILSGWNIKKKERQWEDKDDE